MRRYVGNAELLFVLSCSAELRIQDSITSTTQEAYAGTFRQWRRFLLTFDIADPYLRGWRRMVMNRQGDTVYDTMGAQLVLCFAESRRAAATMVVMAAIPSPHYRAQPAPVVAPRPSNR